jgi:hypothetical protein
MTVAKFLRSLNLVTRRRFFEPFDGERSMRCKSCGSENLENYTAEIAIHFRGLKNINKPHVFVFPVVGVCLDCGTAEFAIGEQELRKLKQGRAASAAEH